MGCGKSTVGRLFEESGWSRIDSDECVKQLLGGDPEVISAVAAHFGQELLHPSGGVDRGMLADRVFKDAGELAWLEQLLHPRVRGQWTSAVAAEPAGRWIVEIPLLFEKKLENAFDITVAVVCSPGKQLARLVSRGISEGKAQSRIARQLPTMEKAALADVVIYNEGSRDFLQRQTTLLLEMLS